MKVENIDNELKKPWEESRYKIFPYSPQKYNFAEAKWRIVYNDGKVIDRPDNPDEAKELYKKISRDNVKSISVVVNDKPIHTLQVKDSKFFIRIKVMVPPIYRQEKLMKENGGKQMDFTNPKRAFILGTAGTIHYVWDSGEVKELTSWGEIEPYRPINLMECER